MTNARIFVKNVPSYAHEYKYWVVTLFDSELWFYSAWKSYEEAKHAIESDKLNGQFIVEASV